MIINLVPAIAKLNNMFSEWKIIEAKQPKSFGFK